MDSRPNVLCISIDSLRADFSPFITGDGDWTPFLSDLANSSTVYTNAISPSTWTLPVHTSIFTGLYPPEHGVIDEGFILDSSHPTFAELLREHGFSTDWYGRNGWLKVGDILRGFDDDAGTVDQINDVFTSTGKARVLIRELLDSYAPTLKQAASQFYHNPLIRKIRQRRVFTDWRDENTISDAINGIKNAEEPFCKFVHLNDVHWPYKPPKTYAEQYTTCSRLKVELNKLRYQNQVYAERERYWAGLETPNKTELKTMRNLYKGAIRYADDLLSELIQSLKQAGEFENTIIILFGDHGDSFGENGRIGHHLSLADELIRVPLLIRDPTRRIAPGTVTQPVQLNDLYPTILELCGLTPPSTNSVSLLDGSREFAFSHYIIPNPSHMEHFLNRVAETELPPREQVRVWKSDEKNAIYYPAEDESHIVGEAGQVLMDEISRHKETLDTIASDREATVSREVRANLEDMGYI
jgi:arylsulfatase A-like enzyme